MKTDVVSQTSEHIKAIIDKNIARAKEDCIKFRLENREDECEPPKLKLKLHIIHKEGQSSQIVSSCLSPDEIGKIQEIISQYCDMRKAQYRATR